MGDVVIRDNRSTQQKAIDHYGDQPGSVRRVTIDEPVSVGIDGRCGKGRNSHGFCSGLKEHSVAS